MKVFRRRVQVCFAAVAAVTAVACTDVEPTSIVRSPSASRHDETATTLSFGTDTVVTVFAVDPTVTASYPIASIHRLWIRAGGVCALNSPYGPAYWNAPCEAATAPIVVTAKSWLDANQHPHVEFWPALRFANLSGKRDAAELYMKDRSAATNPSATILYCDAGVCVDESLTDPTLATSRDKQQGFVYRRIKHFSGYEVVAGDGTTDPQ